MDEPTHYLNYKGDKRGMDNMVGPTWDGHMLVPVDAEYNPDTNRTRVGFVTQQSLLLEAQKADG